MIAIIQENINCIVFTIATERLGFRQRIQQRIPVNWRNPAPSANTWIRITELINVNKAAGEDKMVLSYLKYLGKEER